MLAAAKNIRAAMVMATTHTFPLRAGSAIHDHLARAKSNWRHKEIFCHLPNSFGQHGGVA